MVKYEINGITKQLGALRTGISSFQMDKFTQQNIGFRIKKPSGRTVVAIVSVKQTIAKALAHIDKRCASQRRCNAYFQTLNTQKPISLRQILDRKTLYIFRLKPLRGATLKKIPEGYCYSWGSNWAQIGLNDLAFALGYMEVAHTLLHELAHVAGAPGLRQDPKSLAAETATLHCGMRKYFDPKAFGALDPVPGPEDARTALA